MFGASEKKFLKYAFFIFFALLMAYTALLRSSLYDIEGLPKNETSLLRLSGENAAADYALLGLLEKDRNSQEAYAPANQSKYMEVNVGTKGRFASISSPTLPFLIVPWQGEGYGDFHSTWSIWGIFLFSVSLYALFSFKKALFLTFAMPAVFFGLAFGGWGLYVSAAFILSLNYSKSHPVWAGIFAGLTVILPFYYFILLFVLFYRKDIRAGSLALLFGMFIFYMASVRYGLASYGNAWNAAVLEFSLHPCTFMTLSSALMCSGFPSLTAYFVQLVADAYIIYYGICLLHRKTTPAFVMNAYLCGAALFMTPFAFSGDYVLMYAMIAFLLKDSEKRGFLRGEKVWIALAFLLPFIDAYVVMAANVSLGLILLPVFLHICWKRSY